MILPDARGGRAIACLVALSAVVCAARPSFADPPPAPAVALAPTDPAPESSGSGSSTTAGLTLGAVGLVGIAVGSVFGVLASSAWSNVTSGCGPSENPGHCVAANPSQVSSDHDAASRDAGVATVSFIAGSILVVAGGALLLRGWHHDGDARQVSLAPTFGPGHGGFALSGSF